MKLLQKIWDPLRFGLALLTLAVDRNRWREFLPFLSIPAAMLAVTVPLHFEARYLLPASLVWILLAAVPVSATFFPSPPPAADDSSAPTGA